MSSARAQANHKLYLAKIQLAAWRQAVAAQDIPAIVLTQAFLPAARAHLVEAYGWFLLAVSGLDQLPGKPPARCSELPDVAAGKAMPGEIREFEQLEKEGWLAQLLAEPDEGVRSTRAQGNLAIASPVSADSDSVQQWVDHLEALFARMSDSLEEY
jgi:Family of unknown function (DUF6586)